MLKRRTQQNNHKKHIAYAKAQQQQQQQQRQSVTATRTTITDPKEYMLILEQKIKVYYPNKIDALLRFRQTITNDESKTFFDKEDLNWIDIELEKYTKELDVLQKEYQHKDHIYQNGLLNFENMLSNRERILNELNEETNLFEEVPSLREAFVKKHVELVKNLNKLKETLCAEIIS